MLDTGHDAPRIAHPLRDQHVGILGRPCSDRVKRRPTPPRVRAPKGGRPPNQGGEFVIGDPTTWGTVQAWAGALPACPPATRADASSDVLVGPARRTAVAARRRRSGRHRMAIPWDHIVTLEVSPSTSGKETHDEVHLWLRAEEAHRYRGFRRLGAHLTAAELHIVTLGTKAGALRISPTRLYDALGRFARERFRTGSPAALRERER
ncbi:hypothetical protein ABT147_01440 [Streptomyces sp. NPDC001868]|uniref:hypothetical protein n=1 Tax=Streptomyces sp. NPDC001868 TaxID=3154401 RepID=UPI0033224E3A